jgi:hypothetical protein
MPKDRRKPARNVMNGFRWLLRPSEQLIQNGSRLLMCTLLIHHSEQLDKRIRGLGEKVNVLVIVRHLFIASLKRYNEYASNLRAPLQSKLRLLANKKAHQSVSF